MQNLLDKIISKRREDIEKEKRKHKVEIFMKSIKERGEERNFRFRQAISGKNRIKLIAEIKRKSPTEGILRKGFDLNKIIRIYSEYADAISIVTERHFFGGGVKFIKEAKNAVRIPLLRKDFIIDSYQVYESAYYGADAILLIASILKKEELKNLIRIAGRFGMDVIVEVHNERDLRKILEFETIIGINNRNLRNFSVDLAITKNLVKNIPKGKVIISESGIRDGKDIEELKGAVDAVLVGSSIMKADDMKEKLRELKHYG